MAEEKRETTYVILADNAGDWAERGQRDAANAEQAIRRYVEAAAEGDKQGTFIAVPVRQFKPVTVKVETVPKITFGGESEPEATPEEAYDDRVADLRADADAA